VYSWCKGSNECTPPYLFTGISNPLQPADAEVLLGWGMHHTSTALYFYRASKKTQAQGHFWKYVTVFQISYSLKYYIQLLC
jgi:hypothetical protein